MALEVVEFAAEGGGNLRVEVVEGREADAVVGQVADVAGAAPVLAVEGAFEDGFDGAVQPLEAGGQEDGADVGQGVVLVGVDADAPLGGLLGGGEGPAAGVAAGGEDDVDAFVGDDAPGVGLSGVGPVEGTDVAAEDADVAALGLVVVADAVDEGDDELVDGIDGLAADPRDGGIVGVLQVGPRGGEVAGGEGAFVDLEGEGLDVGGGVEGCVDADEEGVGVEAGGAFEVRGHKGADGDDDAVVALGEGGELAGELFAGEGFVELDVDGGAGVEDFLEAFAAVLVEGVVGEGAAVGDHGDAEGVVLGGGRGGVDGRGGGGEEEGGGGGGGEGGEGGGFHGFLLGAAAGWARKDMRRAGSKEERAGLRRSAV